MNYGELDLEDKKDIGRLATWSVSSDKIDHGIELLWDNDLETYWQSDGPQPHLINMQFEKKMPVQQVSFYYDYKQDESYTPLGISIRGGTAYHDLKELVNVELEKQTGWVNISLEDSPGSGRPPKVFLLQMAILSNQLGGRDTHIRQLKLLSTREPLRTDNDQSPFISPVFLNHTMLR
ncbi:Anaphase-promoting complex subunit 10 [Lobosporangium transversale]|uniref:Anaphase-promoting complex subunit 10 n=1 Tax=Lobosporangium transversale TaxID=64571 RepID=A0A1Y2GU60_9FUNG|nr:anaphase-promoting complex, subunit 10/DOC domain-containing protein [Lobosporangium transversale]KAF9913082.1 Anaphase-promoting complex subunit 10 [Lobosporangium transversale]ORZ21806.1 anaphase-promoting complex, subunit 10/DOC domain-containing protein [Lobosporangium transversale]|eukprot:XP_021883057.1 anaphase-promoting complex, subunit 10/DOC domain-containing protein [Lobosporangium transversale]